MDNEKVQKDNIYDRRHKMQKAYNKLAKQHWVTLLICLFAGWTGAHRFYLGDYKVGAGILVFALSRLLIEKIDDFYPSDFLGSLSYFGLVILLIIVVIELFLAAGNADNANRKIKKIMNEGYDLL